jgi:hypothetical protein
MSTCFEDSSIKLVETGYTISASGTSFVPQGLLSDYLSSLTSYADVASRVVHDQHNEVHVSTHPPYGTKPHHVRLTYIAHLGRF